VTSGRTPYGCELWSFRGARLFVILPTRGAGVPSLNETISTKRLGRNWLVEIRRRVGKFKGTGSLAPSTTTAAARPTTTPRTTTTGRSSPGRARVGIRRWWGRLECLLLGLTGIVRGQVDHWRVKGHGGGQGDGIIHLLSTSTTSAA